MASFFVVFFVLLWQYLSLHAAAAAAGGGSWVLLKPSIGISAMHMQLLNNDRVIIYDRIDLGQSNISLAPGKCPPKWKDCSAHSVEYDVQNNSVRPLTVLTDVWCSSGSVNADGSLIQTGGEHSGMDVVRVLQPCTNKDTSTCDWLEIPNSLAHRRWYATNHLLPDGRQIIIGGNKQFNYEFYPKTGATSPNNTDINFPFLKETCDSHENNLYPYVFLNVDGNVFVFANNRAILFDYTKNMVVRTYPQIPGGDPRNYPSTGSAVLLPLTLDSTGVAKEAEVLICGGAPKGSVDEAKVDKFVTALDTCGRLKITDPSPQWVMEKMPQPRVMGDMLLLPNTEVLIINGGYAGTAGWEFGRNPVLFPVIYRHNQVGYRFRVQNQTKIPRMYHSTAIVLRDGRVLVGGSNPHPHYNFTAKFFPTELSLEAFSPSYLDPKLAPWRPQIISPMSQHQITYGEVLTISFMISGNLTGNYVSVTMLAPPFNTHSFSMNQRLLVLGGLRRATSKGNSTYEVQVPAPKSTNLAPSGYYLLFVVHRGIPSEGIWVKIQ